MNCELLWFFSWVVCLFFFFKQKTAYEMRISDCGSDVCSSDLLVCVDAGHDRLHAFGPTITVRIGAVEQGYMGRRVSELDLLEHSLPYVGGQKIGTAGQGVAEVEADCLGIGEDPAGLMVDEGR